MNLTQESETALVPSISDKPWNVYHRQCVRAAQDVALFAALTGLELLQQKNAMAHGEWLPWVKDNCHFSRRTASSYLNAADRAMNKLFIGGFPAPSALTAENFDELKRALADMFEHDELGEQRAALIAAIRPAKPKALPCNKKKRSFPGLGEARGPRPLFSPKAAVPQVVERWRVTQPAVRNAFLEAIREEALAYLVP